MPNQGASQTAAAQQGQQIQGEKYLAGVQKGNEQTWLDYLAANPNPASTWSGIAAPNLSGTPATVGGGSFGGPSGGTLRDAVAMGPWKPGGGGYEPAPPPSNPPPSKIPYPKSWTPPNPSGKGSSGGGNGKSGARA